VDRHVAVVNTPSRPKPQVRVAIGRQLRQPTASVVVVFALVADGNDHQIGRRIDLDEGGAEFPDQAIFASRQQQDKLISRSGNFL
jgi:hypothetical protein